MSRDDRPSHVLIGEFQGALANLFDVEHGSADEAREKLVASIAALDTDSRVALKPAIDAALLIADIVGEARELRNVALECAYEARNAAYDTDPAVIAERERDARQREAQLERIRAAREARWAAKQAAREVADRARLAEHGTIGDAGDVFYKTGGQ